jgi:hypothetical protein
LEYPFNLKPAIAAVLLLLSAIFEQDQISIAREPLFDAMFSGISLLARLAKAHKRGIHPPKGGVYAYRLDASAWNSYFPRLPWN